MSAPTVSVVTPVYNGEDYLDECIASVVGQTFEDWRYTVLNNCSTDGSAEIAESWAARDPRIRVVHNDEFLSQTDNLNRAMELVDPSSAWTKMVLADDWIFPPCLERMVEVGSAHPTVGVVGAYRLDDQVVNCDGLPTSEEFVPGGEVARASLLDNVFVSGSPNTLLYRSDLVRARRPFFPPGAWHDDTELFYELLREHDFGYVHEVLTFTRRENESMTTAIRKYDPEHRLDKLIVTMKYGRDFLEPDEFEECRARDEAAYYDYLGRKCQYRIAEGFWEHQHAGLRRVGLQLDRARFARRWLVALMWQLSSPSGVWARIGKRITRRPAAPTDPGDA